MSRLPCPLPTRAASAAFTLQPIGRSNLYGNQVAQLPNLDNLTTSHNLAAPAYGADAASDRANPAARTAPGAQQLESSRGDANPNTGLSG